jgi:hypothetical protein
MKIRSILFTPARRVLVGVISRIERTTSGLTNEQCMRKKKRLDRRESVAELIKIDIYIYTSCGSDLVKNIRTT